MGSVKLMLAESPPHLAEYLPALLNPHEFEMFTTGVHTLISANQSCRPDLVILVGNEHLHTLIELRQNTPAIKVLFLVESPSLDEGRIALKFGATGYLWIDDFLDDPTTVIHTALAGIIIFPKILIPQLFS